MNDDPARARYFVIQMLRISGVALVVLGIAIIRRKIDLPEIAGYFIAAVGLFDALLMPSLLARKWKTPLP